MNGPEVRNVYITREAATSRVDGVSLHVHQPSESIDTEVATGLLYVHAALATTATPTQPAGDTQTATGSHTLVEHQLRATVTRLVTAPINDVVELFALFLTNNNRSHCRACQPATVPHSTMWTGLDQGDYIFDTARNTVTYQDPTVGTRIGRRTLSVEAFIDRFLPRLHLPAIRTAPLLVAS